MFQEDSSGSRLYAAEAGASLGLATSSMYLLEALGSGAGGILASLVLIRYLTAFQIATLLGWLNLVAASALAIRRLAFRRAWAEGSSTGTGDGSA